MSEVFILTLTAAEGRYEELASAMQAILPDTAAFKGAEMIRAAGDPVARTVTIYEVWDTAESHTAYTTWRGERGDSARLGAMLGAAPTLQHLANLF
jgi:heme-degrading monooxygenase HmoA